MRFPWATYFKIFCRNRSDAEKLFEATRLWLKERLGLEISPEKSKIVNLKRHYSEFLGFRLKLHKKGKTAGAAPKYTVKSHISQKAERKIRKRTTELIKEIQCPTGKLTGYDAVNNYNAYVIGIHNYYSKATHVTLDFAKIAFSVKNSLKARFKTGLKLTGKHLFPHIKERYGASSQLRYIHNTAVIPIGYIQHRNPMFKKRVINKYTADGRAEIHKQLQNVNMKMLTYLMRNPVIGGSLEYNDNRLSLYCAQMGKCAVSGVFLQIGAMHCHHKTPVSLGGTDGYMNLILVADEIHRLIHATEKETILKYLEKLNLNKRQLTKLNKLRTIAECEEI